MACFSLWCSSLFAVLLQLCWEGPEEAEHGYLIVRSVHTNCKKHSMDKFMVSLDPKTFWPREEGSGENLTQKCLERWYAAVGVDGGRNATSANQLSSFTSVRIW